MSKNIGESDGEDVLATTRRLRLESRVAQLEATAKTWYERHVPLIVGVLAFLIGWTVGHVHL